VRSRLYLETINGDSGEEIAQGLRVLRIMKANYGPKGQEMRLRWQNGLFILDGPALDALRGFAIALVIACHYFGLKLGVFGVDLFFVLSGFLIGEPAGRRPPPITAARCPHP
jgi:hypothetical protein